MDISVQKVVTVSIGEISLSQLDFLYKAVKQYNDVLPRDIENQHLQSELEAALAQAR